MKNQNISNGSNDVYIECPHCQHWETHPIDEQRHHIQTFDIKEWKPDEKNKPEVSIMQCHSCKGEFELTWNYNGDNKVIF